jgi:SEC-C motif-containing protein
MTNVCPCDTGKLYRDCCECFHRRQKQPESALALMRSRYSAFALGLSDYILDTQTKNDQQERDALETSLKQSTWVRLEIVEATETLVEFIASFIEDNQLFALSERSRFERQPPGLIYLNGDAKLVTAEPLPTRNDRCWCQSGKKFKRCHGANLR